MLNPTQAPDRRRLHFGRLLFAALVLLVATPALAEINLIWSCSSATAGSTVNSCAGTASWQIGANGKLVASATAFGAFGTGTWRLWENVPQDEYVYACSANLAIGAPAGCPVPGDSSQESYVLKASLAPPSVRIGTAALVSPTSANANFPTAADSTHTNSLGTSGRPNEIVELARALRNNPDLIYDFVRNNVDTVWMYGLQKGAVGAIVDKSGTPFDQAHLMVELLRQAGYSTAAYKVGTVTLNGTQFQQWTDITSAAAACQLLSSGGIPATVNGSTDVTNCSSLAGSVSTVTLAHAWVSVSISGGPYLFDPSYKPYTFKAGVSLNTAAGLTTGQAMTQSATGMTSGTASGVPYSANLGMESLYGLVEGYANNLLSHINSNFPTGEVDDLVGGRAIVRYVTPSGGLRQTSLPYSASTVHRTWAAEVPDQYRTSLRVQVTKGSCTTGAYPTIIDHKFYADDIYARRLVLGGSFLVNGSSTTVTLTVKNEAGVGTTVYSGNFSCNPGFNVGAMTLTADHPYPSAANGTTTLNRDYMDVIAAKTIRFASPLVIVHGWGDAGRGLVEKLGSRMDTTLVPLITSGCETCAVGPRGSKGDGRREQLAASWLAQSSTGARLHAEIAKSVYQHHHSIGVVEAESEVRGFPFSNPNPLAEYRYTIIDSFDRFDIESGFSLTSKSADATVRRAAVHAIAATIDALEGSASAQAADLPDTASTATRFEWGNRPPVGEDPAPGSSIPRRFYSFTSANAAQAVSLVKVELQTTTANDGYHSGSVAEIGSSELNWRRGKLSSAISQYAGNGYSVIAAEDAFLGPGQRAGAFVEDSNGVTWHHRNSKQRSGALIATKYSGSDPVEIAHVTVGADANSKGGGGAAQPTQQAQYDPSQAADILKSRFVDRSKALGVDMLAGGVGAASPASLSVGNGGFPYELSASLSWSGGNQQPTSVFGPVSHTEPQAPWTTNWNNTLTVSGSGMEMMDGDVRSVAGTIAAFLAAQDIYKSAQSIQREVASALVGAWWVRQLTGNVVTVNVGADTRQFVRLVDYYGNPGLYIYIAPGSGPQATLSRTGWRSKFEEPSCGGGEPSYVTSRGWNYSSVSFQVTNANGDVQSFPHWTADFDGGGYCAFLRGFRLSAWTFPQGVTINLVYAQGITLGAVPELMEVNNTLGRKITFINSGRGGFTNGLTGGDLRAVTVTGDPASSGIITHAEPNGAITKFNVSIVGEKYLLTQIFNANNGTTPSLQYDYDTLRRVKEARDAVALQVGGRNPYQFFIGESVRSERVDPAGGVYSIFYDDRKRPLSVIDEIGRTISVSHDSRGRVKEYLYPELDRERLEYDLRNNVTRLTKMPKGCIPTTSPPYCSPAELVVQASWNATWNKPDSIIDARGNQTEFTYVPVGTNGTSLLQQARRPIPEPGKPQPIYNFSYNSRGQLVDATDPTGLISRNAYFAASPFNLQTTTLDPGGLNAVTMFAYDPIGNTTAVTDPRSNVTEPAYDNNRRKTVVKHHDGAIGAMLLAAERTTYDLLGQVTKEEGCTVFSGTNITTCQTLSETTYTKTGQVETSKNGAGNTTTTFYDPVDRVDIIQDPQNRKVKNFYDAAGQVLCMWRGWNGIFPGYSGASSGQPCRWDAPTSYAGLGPARYAEFTYTTNGQRDTVKDANNNLSKQEYDPFDRLIELHFPNGTAGSGMSSATDFESYGYDENGNRTSLTKRDRTTVIGFQYDTLNRLIVKDLPGGTANDVAFEYDEAGRPKWAKYVDDNGSGIVYSYGQAKRLTSEATFGRSVGFDYDLASNRTKVIWPDGNFVYSNFDNLNRVNKVCENGSAGCATGLLATVTLDPLSRRSAIARPNGASSGFGYDLASRLTSLAQDVSGTTNDLSRTFTYNLASQLQTRINATAAHAYTLPTANRGYAVNGRNQYTTVAGVTQTHDLNGNLTSDGARSFGYDAENRLTSVSGSQSLSLTYDPLGRLRQTTAGATTTDFLYDGDRLIAEYNGSTLLRRYAHGSGVDEPIVWYEGATLTTKRWLHPDERGSIVAWTDGSANATVYRYGPYGEPAGGDFSGSRFRYTGQIALPEVSLYHYKARIYDPIVGRFLQTDPVGYQDDFNLYAYVRNDPLNHTDPTGAILDTIADIGFILYDVYAIATEGATATNLAALGADVAGAVTPFATGGGIAVRAAAKGAERAAITVRAEQGAAREAKVAAALKAENPSAKVQNQQYLRDANGKIVKDPITGEGRRVDHAVIKDGQAQTVETTSMNADKGAQLRKEERVRDAGGTYVRDRETRQVVPVCSVSEVRRCP
jgi:RHS repeat-associated protein